MKKLRLAGIGCGGRTLTYFELAARMPHLYDVVGAADPLEERVEMARKYACNPEFRAFKDDKALFAEPRFADIIVIGTQDAYHFQPAKEAMEKGYDILLEKPIAQSLEEVFELERIARRLKRKVLICHVLRYAPFYCKIKEIIDSGRLGRVISINALEGVTPWHQAHSYVRGKAAITNEATPMIIAKSCHDTDIISWLVGSNCLNVSSYGDLTFFKADNAPVGAPERCTDGCPAEADCMYNALHYITMHRPWLLHVFHAELEKKKQGGASPEEIRAWLTTSQYGRCVYRCANTAVDHQVVSMKFANQATATFTMTAFAHSRGIEIFGTKAMLRGGCYTKIFDEGSDIVVQEHATNDLIKYNVNQLVGGYSGHGGGDPGLMLALYKEMSGNNPEQMRSSIHNSMESHLIGFAAEESRIKGYAIDLNEYRKRFQS